MAKYILVVVDVQPGIRNKESGINSCPWSKLITDQLVANVGREIEAAKALGCPIIDLTIDYWGCNDDWFGPTDARLMKLLKGYPLHRSCPKRSSDGSRNLLSLCRHEGISLEDKTFVLVGVQSSACVLETAAGLVREIPDANVVVVKDACNDFNGSLDWAGAYAKHAQVKVAEGAVDVVGMLAA